MKLLFSKSPVMKKKEPVRRPAPMYSNLKNPQFISIENFWLLTISRQ
jgi:hypothetical protein